MSEGGCLNLSAIFEDLRASPMYPAMNDADIVGLIARGFVEQAITHEHTNPCGVSEVVLSERIRRLEAARELCPTLEQIEEQYLSLAAMELARQRSLLLLGHI